MKSVGEAWLNDAWRIGLLVLALVFAVLALSVPVGWFVPAKVNGDLAPAPFDGVALLRICLLLDAGVLLALGLWGGRRRSVAGMTEPVPLSDHADDIARRPALVILAAVTLLGIVLRVYRLNSGLWLDEISSVTDYGNLSSLQVIATYLGTNNHLLNTLLVNSTVSLFGDQAWAVRLPAAVFGMLTIPALYWTVRQALSRRASLTAAALLAASYHHVFFSQNARGYSAYLFFSVLACDLLVVALKRDRLRDWALYTGVAALNVVALLNGAFVVASHGLIATVVTSLRWRRTGSMAPLQRVLAAHLMIGLLVLQVYALIIPQILAVMNTTYKMASAGFASPFSPEFIRDLVQGLSPALAIGASVVAGGAAIVGALGLWRVWRANAVLAAALVLPNVLLLGSLVIAKVSVTPRLFLFALIPAVVFLAAAIEWAALVVAGRTSRRIGHALHAISVGMVLLAFLGSLQFYYATPKQDYAGAVDYLQAERRPGDVVIVAYLAKYGYSFYARQRGIPLDAQTYFVRDGATFDALVAANRRRRIWVVSTFERALRLDYPTIARALQTDWVVTRRFRGTIGDGNILVYRNK